MVSLLHQLTMEALLSETAKELRFRILNRGVAFCPYDRAALWGFEHGRPVLLGVSGQATAPEQSELKDQWTWLVRRLAEPGREGVLGPESFQPAARDRWKALTESPPRPGVVWLPIMAHKRLVAGLWLERWEDRPWWDKDVKLLKSLLLGYGLAWEKLCRPPRARRRYLADPLSQTLLLLLPVAAALYFLQVPLRVVAPCEVTPRDPFIVAAPLEGVIDQVVARPGAAVSPGDPLFVYDKRVATEELAVARQQVQIVQSTLTRVRNQAFLNPQARSEIALLELKLEQEQTRLRLAEHRASQLVVEAEVAGRAVLDDPNEWRGRPVAVGQRVLMIVDPGRTMLRIWLPVDDNVVFDRARPVRVQLNAFPERTLEAILEYVAGSVSLNAAGLPAIVAEAAWTGDAAGVALGLQGTCTLRGEDVRLGYWLLRKPWSWARRTFGF